MDDVVALCGCDGAVRAFLKADNHAVPRVADAALGQCAALQRAIARNHEAAQLQTVVGVVGCGWGHFAFQTLREGFHACIIADDVKAVAREEHRIARRRIDANVAADDGRDENAVGVAKVKVA